MSRPAGYDAAFLGSSVPSVPLPTCSATLAEDILERDTLSSSSSDDSRRIYRHYHNYTIIMSKRYKTAVYAALNVDQSQLATTDNTSGWRIDDAVGAEHQLASDYYYGNAWDKGHLAPDAAAGWGATEAERIAATNDTYYYTNATLQHENFNRDEWKDLETTIRAWQKDATNKLSEITGPIFGPDDKSEVVHPDGKEPATVPAGFFKVVAYVGRSGDEHYLQVRCFVIYQDAKCLQDRDGVVDHKSYQVSVADIEALTGLVFDPVYHTANLGYATPPPRTDGTAAVCIAAALVDPAGKDTGAEWISIHNRSDSTISLEGWKLKDQKGRTLLLSGEEVESGTTCTIHPISPIRLVNSGGELTLLDQGDHPVDTVTYTKQQVKEGEAVDFLAGL